MPGLLGMQPLHDAVYVEAMRALAPNWNSIERFYAINVSSSVKYRRHTHFMLSITTGNHQTSFTLTRASTRASEREVSCASDPFHMAHRSILMSTAAQTLSRHFTNLRSIEPSSFLIHLYSALFSLLISLLYNREK